MLAIFSNCKPFTHPLIRTIQRNAIQSWLRIHPTPKILLFGDREGVAETAAEFGVTHVKGVRRTETGCDRMDDVITRGYELTTYDTCVYANCDMILPPYFGDIVRAIDCERYLVIGQRWNTDVIDELDFAPGWWRKLETYARATGHSGGLSSMDYFVHQRGMFAPLPELAVGMWFTDNYLVSRALADGVPVIDASEIVFAIHQQHTHDHYPGGLQGIADGVESAQAKASIIGDVIPSIGHATMKLYR